MVLNVKDVSFSYEGNEKLALDRVSFSINQGEWVALVGHNGSGKSTLACLLIGLISGAGEIRVDDTLVTSDSVWDVRKKVGIVFQNPDNQFVGATVEDDVAFGLENAGVPQKEMRTRIHDALEIVGMKDFINQEPHQLSGGQKQRVALASVLALRPQLIILDEATSMLDPVGKMEVLSTLNALRREKGVSILSITHDLEEAAQADRVVVLNKGCVFATGTPSEVFVRGDALIQIGLDLPFHLQVKRELTHLGIDVDLNEDAQSLEGVVSALCELYSKM